MLAYDAQLGELADDWFVHETVQYLKRTLKRLDVTSRSLVAVIEPGSCFAGFLLELALACDRQYMLEGVYEDVDPDADPAVLVLTEANDGRVPDGQRALAAGRAASGATTTSSTRARKQVGERLDAQAADAAGLVTMALDDIDFEEEIRIVLEERASLSPDALTGMEANHRFVGPETRGDQDLRPADRLAELDLHPAQRVRARRRAAPLRHRAAGQLRPRAGVT